MTAPKVFLSYAHVDSDMQFVSKLHERLRRDGIECFFDEESLAPGVNFVLKISEAIDECNFLVMVMTRAYFSARFAPLEWTAVVSKDPENERGRLVPLLLEECDLPAVIRPLTFIDVSSAEKFEKNYPSIWRRLGRLNPNDIEQRSREIDDLFEENKVEQGIKRLLDFARDFDKQPKSVNRLKAIKMGLEHFKEECDTSARVSAWLQLVTDGLNLKDEIINTLSLEIGR